MERPMLTESLKSWQVYFQKQISCKKNHPLKVKKVILESLSGATLTTDTNFIIGIITAHSETSAHNLKY